MTAIRATIRYSRDNAYARTFSDLDGGRNNNFDFLRMLFAAAVIFSHSYLLVGSPREPFGRLTHGQAAASTYAVAFFFAISGYLITRSWTTCAGAAEYLWRRVLRIHPGLIVAAAFSYLVVAPIGSGNAAAYLASARPLRGLAIPLFVPLSPPTSFPNNPFPGNVNGSLWTIPCEFLMYLFVMAAGLAGLFRRRYAVLALFAAVFLSYRGIPRIWPVVGGWPLPYFGIFIIMLHLLSYFLAGMVAFLFRDRIPHSGFLFALSVAVLAVCNRRWLNGVMPIFGTYAMFYVAFSPYLPFHRFARHGDFSYGTYLYAFPIQQLLVLVGIKAPIALFVASLPLTVAAAVLSWHYVEAPFLRMKHRRDRDTCQKPPSQAGNP